jgi:hypothetical protein
MKFLFIGLVVISLLGACKTISEKSHACKEGVVINPVVDLNTLKKKIERYVPVKISYDQSALNDDQKKAVDLLVKASLEMDNLFWEQATDKGLALLRKLKNPKDEFETLLARYLRINYGPYDRLDDFEPFIKVPPRPAGATFYPQDISKEEFNSWLEKNPDDKEAFQSCFTVIKRDGQNLVAVPYSKHYQAKLEKAEKYLKEAAGHIENPSLKKYLISRADAFKSNNYRQSDMDWMDVKDSLLEVTIGPYEVYEDRLFNYKAAFESFIAMRDAEASQKLAKLGTYQTEMEKNLPIADEYKNFERGTASPILMVDLIYSAGDTRAGVQTLAFNLPNDEVVREQKGSKKVMLKNILRAKFDAILTPIAKVVLVESQQKHVTFDAYFNHVLLHEMSHGIGPGRIEKDGKKVTVSLLLKELYSAVEEAKADTLGVYNTDFLISKGDLEASMWQDSVISFLAGVFRSVRFGAHESHGKANLMAFNYLVENGVIEFNSDCGCYAANIEKSKEGFTSLAKELLLIEAKGDYPAAQTFIAKYAVISKEMQSVLDKLSEIPVDIQPIFEIEEKILADH